MHTLSTCTHSHLINEEESMMVLYNYLGEVNYVFSYECDMRLISLEFILHWRDQLPVGGVSSSCTSSRSRDHCCSVFMNKRV